jgi:cytoskeletal protein CcmA (bactofilin family)
VVAEVCFCEAMMPRGLRRKVNPLSEKHKSARYSQSRTDTLIGPGVRVEGNITFTGVLRTDGEIIGDVSCDGDTHGTIVVGKLGNVTGAIKAPHIVVGGRVHGPVHSSETIEIHQDACVVGDASYKDIEVHEGGVIDGALTRRFATEEDRSGQEHRVQSSEPPAVKEYDEPLADAKPDVNGIAKRPGRWRKFGAATALLIAVLTVLWVNRGPTIVTPPVADDVLKANTPPSDNLPPQALPVESATPLDSPKAATGNTVPLVPSSEAVTKNAVQAPPPDVPEPDLKHVAVVHGDNPSKSGDVLYVISKEPSVLFRKQRQDSADGTRIDVAQGTSKRIAIAKDDILRVEQGGGLQMFYQGRKVASATIESGAWISFVPYSRSGASDK